MSKVMIVTFEEESDYDLVLERIGDMDEDEKFEGVLTVRQGEDE